MISIDKLDFIKGPAISRPWRQQFNGCLWWQSDERAKIVHLIADHNRQKEPREVRGIKQMTSREGQLFDPYDHRCHLEDFVFLYDRQEYFHLPTGLTFDTRQINKRIFRNPHLWPRASVYAGGEPPPNAFGEAAAVRPSAFIFRFNRVNSTPDLLAAMEELK